MPETDNDSSPSHALSQMAVSKGAAHAATTLRMLSHPDRLKVLCYLTTAGELSVGELLERVDLSPSALSQHLAKLRQEQLVETRKERQTVFYRVERTDVVDILKLLYRHYCKEG